MALEDSKSSLTLAAPQRLLPGGQHCTSQSSVLWLEISEGSSQLNEDSSRKKLQEYRKFVAFFSPLLHSPLGTEGKEEPVPGCSSRMPYVYAKFSESNTAACFPLLRNSLWVMERENHPRTLVTRSWWPHSAVGTEPPLGTVFVLEYTMTLCLLGGLQKHSLFPHYSNEAIRVQRFGINQGHTLHTRIGFNVGSFFLKTLDSFCFCCSGKSLKEKAIAYLGWGKFPSSLHPSTSFSEDNWLMLWLFGSNLVIYIVLVAATCNSFQSL